MGQIRRVFGPLEPIMLPVTWWFANKWAGVRDITYNTPASVLPAATSKQRPVQLVQNSVDTLVTKDQTEQTAQILSSQQDEYSVAETFSRSVVCNGQTHLVLELRY